MISAKMPPGFNMTAVKDYLQTTWGLGPGRQTGVLLLAITSEPASRLTTSDEAKSFLEKTIQRYSTHAGVSLSIASAGTGASASIGSAVDASMLQAIKADQTDYLRKQMELLAKYLKIDLQPSTQALEKMSAVHNEAQKDLDTWTSEHDEVYAAGIKSSFDANKKRHYDSWWNWGRQEAISLYNEIKSGALKEESDAAIERCSRIVNRSYPALVDALKYMTYNSHDGLAYSNLGLRLIQECEDALQTQPTFRYILATNKPHTVVNLSGLIHFEEIPRKDSGSTGHYVDFLRRGGKLPTSTENIPFVHLRRKINGEWLNDRECTSTYLNALQTGSEDGLTFSGKNVLVTGAGQGSIGAEIVQGLLAGGARVIVTSSRTISTTADAYQSMYMEYGARGSQLTVLPFNQGSVKDCEALIDHIYDSKGLNLDLDAIIPFAAISEAGREIDGLDGRSELAHRLMLVNTLRILGNIKHQKHRRHLNTRPTQVILPLSPNHGTFGGDGLYSESKLGLETLVNRWYSETWGDYLVICGAVIGWTRGTGLMSANNIVAEAIESHGVTTFSQSEMAFNILGLMTPEITFICQQEPVFAYLDGGLQFLPDLKGLLSSARASIMEVSDIRKALVKENSRSLHILNGALPDTVGGTQQTAYRPRANLKFDFPKLPSYQNELAKLSSLEGMVDLSRVVVVVGYSELGPWGNARTRWEMEAFGEFSKEGYVEMAWVMGLVKHFDGQIKGVTYTGWVDSKTGEAIHDDDIKDRYGSQILGHSGIRLVEPELFGGYDPERKEFLHEVAVEEDLEPFEASATTAEAFKLRHGEHVEIHSIEGSAEYSVKLKKGSTLLIPKAVPFDRLVAGQIPTGWNAKKYGVPEDIISQVDPVTIYVLCCVSEAFLSAGITDPYEIYRYIHLSELGNCIGTGTGGLTAMRGMYRDRYIDTPVQKDVLQETFLNTMGAWVNMLLLGSTGPIKSPVGACATALESLDNGFELIVSGKAKMCLVGGADDFSEEMSYEFANMKATSNARDEFAKGRTPKEMSRPTATTRSGFMESQGCGIQVICTAELALEMGLPIHGIVASVATATDKIGRSVPAPGQGILTNARESASAYASPLLDIRYRREQMDYSRRKLEQWKGIQMQKLQGRTYKDNNRIQNHADFIERTVRSQMKDIQNDWGNNFAKQDPGISPIRAALAVWNLTVDDIDIASMHGTSTVANDKNESDVICKQMEHLGRAKGNTMLGVCQKSLTGHPKGAAGAWMFNGALQILDTGIVPGNRNADNVDANLKKFEGIVYPHKTIRTDSVKAVSITSFGFGQKGAQAIAVHPRYLFATLGQKPYDNYRVKVVDRQKQSYLRHNEALMTNSIFRAKTSPPYDPEDESRVYLDPMARVSTTKTNELYFDLPTPPASPISSLSSSSLTSSSSVSLASQASTAASSMTAHSIEQAQESIIQDLVHDTVCMNPSAKIAIGVDVEDLNAINVDNDNFLQRNFTAEEQEYANQQPSPQASFAGRWCAKEAVFKSMNLASKGAGAPMKDIEITRDENGVPKVIVSFVFICN